MDHRLRFEMLLHGRYQWHQLRRTLPHPAGHAGAGNERTTSAVNLFLAKQRQMIVMLGNDHLSQQASRWDAFVNDLGGHRCGQHRLASRTAVFAANVAMHEELSGHAI
jgi:hypothetical protein